MLETIWFVLWGLLWAIYFILDGFDLGLGALLPLVAKTDEERRVVINSMGPFWDGNEVWLITAGGVTFAAFPKTYAIMFSALYSPLMLLLFALIIRGISFEFRSKVENPSWRKFWDHALAVGSFFPTFLFGVAFANLFAGVPIDAEGILQGNLLTFLNPYGLLGGILFLFLFLVHGSLWLCIKSEGVLHQRGKVLVKKLWPVMMAAATLFLLMSKFTTDLYSNYLDYPLLLIIPLAAVLGMVGIWHFQRQEAYLKAWVCSSLGIAGATLWGVLGLYPNLLLSSISPAFSLTAQNSASSPLTLKIMLGITLVMVPTVIAYQAWVYKKFSGKIRPQDLIEGESY